jgi:predicted enzyme related to lactoylglutathione lyase
LTDVIRAGAVLYAKDVDRVASFYVSVLGLKAADRDEEHVLLESPAFELVVRRIPARLAEIVRIADPPKPRQDAAVKLVFFVSSISEARACAQAHGGAVDETAKEWSFHGWHVWDGLDPEGNVIQFRARAQER